MKSVIENTADEIEVVDEKHERYGRIRIRESAGISGVVKASIFLPADQLEDLAQECLKLAALLRNRQSPDQKPAGGPAAKENAVSEKLSDFDGPGLRRERVLILARAQERLRQAQDLARSAASLLAELAADYDLDLKAEIKLATDARKSCDDAVTRLDSQIAGTRIL